MAIVTTLGNIYNRIYKEGIKLGDVCKLAKEIKRDHQLAMELWGT